jgi:hypothetical protein
MLSGRGLCDGMITRPEEPTVCGASLCVVTKPRERGGHSPRWAAESEIIIIINIHRLSCKVPIILVRFYSVFVQFCTA